MLIGGIQKLTTLDYPGRLAAVVFTVGCNFRCGYCHNPHLVDPERVKDQMNDLVSEEAFFNFLKTRKGLIDGVCVTGGEPTLQGDLIDFASRIKREGFLVKIDTNGTRPDVLEKMVSEKVVDFFAMDIKTSLSNYPIITQKSPTSKSGVDVVKRSKEFIQNCGLEYEFRTTAVRGKHTEEVFEDIGKWLMGAESFYIQNFRNKIVLSGEYKTSNGFTEKELASFKKIMEKYVKKCGIRV